MLKKTVIIIIICLLFGAVPLNAQSNKTTPSGIPLDGLKIIIDDYMAQYIGKTSPGAAVVIVKDGEIIFSKGYGYADIENKVCVKPDETIFEYGSISKLFVYTTIMRLKEQSLIDLKKDIREYLPKGFLKKIKYDKPVTMMNVMNHTTGFEDYLFDVVVTSNTRHTLKDTLTDCQPEQVYSPGTVSAYSNYAVALSAYIAEQIIGQEYYKYLADTIFYPLGMEKTTSVPLIEKYTKYTSIKAKGYYAGKEEFLQGSWGYVPLYPAGGVNGTAEDLAKFAIALMPREDEKSPLFEKSETLNEMLTQTYSMGPGLNGFAHGFIEYDGKYRVLGHGGNTAYFSSQFNIVPEERFGIIVLCNSAGEVDITSGLTEILLGKSINNNEINSNVQSDLKKIEGAYIPARRMHNGFLELYGYLQLVKVRVIDDNTIKLSIGKQSAKLVQTEPYVFKKNGADGKIFKYHFDTVYFDVHNSKVQKISGDYLPLPAGRSIAVLYISLIAALISVLYFVIAPIILLILYIKNKNAAERLKNIKLSSMIAFFGTITAANNLILIARMLINNYRAFSEIKIHIILNYPLMCASLILCILFIGNLIYEKINKREKIFAITTLIMNILLNILLINWQFLKFI